LKPYKIIVSHKAAASLKEIIVYIAKDSPSAAEYVRISLLKLIKSLKTFPDRFPQEPLLSHKKTDYRSVCKWHYKIIYRYTANEVIILDIIHTSRNPKVLKRIE
jgi:plasmid stabilization system protein ParE